MRHKAAAAAPVGQDDSYRGAGAVKLSHRENWECWGYSSSKWLSEKMESEDTTEKGATGHVPVRNHYSRNLFLIMVLF